MTLISVVREALTTILEPELSIQYDTPWYSLGISSIHLIRLKRDIELAMGVADVPLVWLLNSCSVRELATHFQSPQQSRRDSAINSDLNAAQDANTRYDPVIRLRSQGSKAPIWFFHPGVGEVLVFMNLARLIEDRPVYALRARGFNHDETFFEDIDDAVGTYVKAIKSVQPKGPYALAGYSYGAMLAFESAKRLNDTGSGQEVDFLASFNLPPHIKFRMQQLNWTACTLHLASFLGLLPEPDLKGLRAPVSRQELLDAIFEAAPVGRLKELALSPKAFAHWADLAHSMQSMAREYQPSGLFPAMDIFYCNPLAIVARDKQDWLEKHIGHWREFSSDVRFHEVDGEHYTMIDAAHVDGFCKSFTKALESRGM